MDWREQLFGFLGDIAGGTTANKNTGVPLAKHIPVPPAPVVLEPEDELEIVPAEKIRSSAIKVADKPFVEWFNNDFRPLHTGQHPTLMQYGKKAEKFPHVLDGARFKAVFDQCAALYKPELTFEEFLAVFAVIYNETGGTFVPVSEKGSAKYMFEAKNGKQSYNKAPNRPAGDMLQAAGKISDPADVEAWNSTTVYPEPTDPELIAAARECDFWKFRGRGLVQLTWRDKYEKYVDPLLVANGHKKCDELTDAELEEVIRTDPKVYVPMSAKTFKGLATQLEPANKYPPNWSAFGKAIGGSGEYGALLQWRCRTLADAIWAVGYSTS